ncbi:hypothetical protein CDAR_72361 [Caerostris darwini]|uniref:Uncharacterized protein n=1 Tax=Caerostris darwini TaxID=1538125 RepID=A0AAV4MLF9_9ARAC|nr:hypothetical protein CDAR_72361 [Caerostris darwini]
MESMPNSFAVFDKNTIWCEIDSEEDIFNVVNWEIFLSRAEKKISEVFELLGLSLPIRVQAGGNACEDFTHFTHSWADTSLERSAVREEAWEKKLFPSVNLLHLCFSLSLFKGKKKIQRRNISVSARVFEDGISLIALHRITNSFNHDVWTILH